MKTLDYSIYLDRILGGWYGKSIGGVIASQVEGVREFMDFEESQIWPEIHPANDDLTMQVMFLEVVEEKGVYFTQRDLVEAWVQRCWYPFGEYGYFIRNYHKGILPPVSASFDNAIKEHGMGCPIRSEIWAMIAPGDPKLARTLCRLDGTIDHGPQSVAGEEMWAGLEAELFFENDTSNIRKLIEKHRKCLPAGTKIANTVELVLQFYDQGLDMREARRRVIARMGEYDASDARLNVGLTVMALLYGEGNFKKTGLIAMNLGYDTDCTAATALAILGLIYGYKKLPPDWIEKNGPTYVCDIDIRTKDRCNLMEVAERTARAGITMMSERSKACRITNVPSKIQLLSTVVPEPTVKLECDYKGIPSIAIGETKKMVIIVNNETSGTIKGKLDVTGPQGWILDRSTMKLTVPARSKRSIPLTVIVPANCKEICQTNKINVSLDTGKEVKKESFGISGAFPWQVMGLFFDTYNRVKHSAVVWDKGRWSKRYPRGMGNHYFVDLSISYISEGIFDYEGLVKDGRDLLGELATVNAHTSEIPVSQITQFNGEYCVYLLGSIKLDQERDVQMVLGCNDSLKVWVNGYVVYSEDKKGLFIPNDHSQSARIKLIPGTNRIVIKALRRSEQLHLSFQLSEWKGGPKGNWHWLYDLKYVVL